MGRVVSTGLARYPDLAGSGPIRLTLPTGELEVEVRRADWPLESLCGFAARQSGPRGHLIVSKVLGRYAPCRPSTMRATADALARKIPDDLPGPLLIVGLAEAAVCLGQSVHEAYSGRARRDDAVFLSSTRQALDAPLLAGFQEAHSHAPAHLLYDARSPEVGDMIRRARSLVLVDDEASTGATFVNLARALEPHLRRLEMLVAAVLTDWSDGVWRRNAPWATEAVSLLEGCLTFRPAWSREPAQTWTPNAAAFGRAPADLNFGRQGRRDVASEMDRLDAEVSWSSGRPLLVLGSGEFLYPPFRIAERLERQGADVWVQATSRSPIRLGGAIGSVTPLLDDYGSGVPHHLYNAASWRGEVVICHETPLGSVDPDVIASLGARTLWFGAGA